MYKNKAILYESFSVKGYEGIFNFFQQDPIKSWLKEVWSGKPYQNVPFCNERDLNALVTNAYNNKQRNVVDSRKFPNIVSFFPLIDLVALLYPIAKGSGSFKESETVFINWLEMVHKSSPIPIEYIPSDPWTINLKKDFFTSEFNFLGEFRLENMNQNFGFYETLSKILEYKQQFELLKLPSQLKTKFLTSKNVILNAIDLMTGETTKINKTNLEDLYGSSVSEQILTIIVLMYKLYEQQIFSFFPNDDIKRQKYLKDKNLYYKFIGYPQSQVIEWSKL